MGTVAIAALRTKILAVLDDATNTKFSNNQVDQAVRDALAEYTRYHPIEATYSFNADGEQVLVMPTSFLAFHVTDLYKDSDPPYYYQFNAYYQDEQWQIAPQVINTKPTSNASPITSALKIPANTPLMAVYSKVNGIDGLDSFAGTTIPDAEIENFAIGAAGYACLSRLANRSEAIVLNQDVEPTLQRIADTYLTAFRAALKGEPKGYVTAAWQLDTDSRF